MATPKSLASLEKSKEAISVIKERLLPVLQRLTDDKFGEATGRAQASVALSIGMMRYMGSRLRGLDRGKKPDDPLRRDLNNIKRILANTKEKKADAAKKTISEPKKSTTPTDRTKTDVDSTKVSNSQSSKKLGLVKEKETKSKSKVQNEKGAASQQGKTSNKMKRKKKSIVNDKAKRRESPSKKARRK